MIIKDSYSVCQKLLARGPVAHEPAISEWYNGALDCVPDRGDSYQLRGLMLTLHDDVSRVAPKYRPQAKALLDHLVRTGTWCIAEVHVVYSDVFGKAALLNPDLPMMPFMFDDDAHRVRADKRRLEATRACEDKVLFAKQWANSGYMPETAIFEPEDPITPERAWNIVACKPAFVKAAMTASGNDNVYCGTYDELFGIMCSPEWKGRRYVIQKAFGAHDMSINYFIADEGVYFLFCTTQVNDGVVHTGNVLCAEYDALCITATKAMVLKARRDGVRGFCGYDLRVSADYKEVKVVECNARMTAPVYGYMLALKHDVTHWLVMNVYNVAHDTLEALVPESFEYNPTTKRGIICHNPGPLTSERAVSVTALGGSKEELFACLEAFKAHACEPEFV